MQLEMTMRDFTERAVSPFAEFGAYEALWDEQGASFKSIAARFAADNDILPTDLVPRTRAMEYANRAHAMLNDAGVKRYGVRVNGTLDYPDRLRNADHPLELFTYQGWWELVDAPLSIAVVGTRNPTNEGLLRTRQLVKALIDDEVTIVSGLAQGVDTAAHAAAINHGGRTIAVLGTPLSLAYPKANAKLQQEIAERHLLISQVPVVRYFKQSNLANNNHFFPARNITMSALTDATIIVEAGETSGTLVQARHALKQGRKLFILESNFHRIGLEWPFKFEDRGAIRVTDYTDVRRHLFTEDSTAH